METEPVLLTDKDIARLLKMSPEWVRQERFKRAKGQPHFLKLDARHIGRSVRYVRKEVDDFVASVVA